MAPALLSFPPVYLWLLVGPRSRETLGCLRRPIVSCGTPQRTAPAPPQAVGAQGDDTVPWEPPPPLPALPQVPHEERMGLTPRQEPPQPVPEAPRGKRLGCVVPTASNCSLPKQEHETPLLRAELLLRGAAGRRLAPSTAPLFSGHVRSHPRSL